FIALRCKDTIAPTGTIAQGVGAKQVNSLGEEYQWKYGNTTAQRVYGTLVENLEGRGPCYLKTDEISEEQEQDLMKAYLNMSPGQTLKWIDTGRGPKSENVEIEGTEPYIVGGHTASGYWVDTNRGTTIKGLYAAGDVAGGCPQKYVTGALVEGEIAGDSALSYIESRNEKEINKNIIDEKLREIKKYLSAEDGLYKTQDLEESMQKVMDTYAGGITASYKFNKNQLKIAKEKIENINKLTEDLKADDMHELMKIFELRERLVVSKTLIAHLEARKETRWHSFAENADYPEKDDNWLKFVNSVTLNGEPQIILRELVKRGEKYEHKD
ncbi:MAG: adenylylsulfate reductase, partial [Paraclostridium sp.]